jgi:tRNA (guanosine-2'-O-)-methyltransferase
LTGGFSSRLCGIAALLVACGPSAPARSPAAKLNVANVAGPPGVTLVQACTPTGPELCFNAVDDNCNGVIDEGCGEQTGLLQFTVAWSAATADVNLAVTTPAHERVPSRDKSAAPGFHLDHDCPAEDGCNGQNEENVYFDGADPPKGHYLVEISLVDLHGAEAPVKVRFGARLGTRVVGFDVDLSPGDDAKKTFGFDLM